MPSPSVSPAFRKADVSAAVSARAEAEKFCRKSLQGEKIKIKKDDQRIHDVGSDAVTDVQCVSLQLVFLDEPALVLVDDVEGLLQLVRGLSSQPTGGEELLVVE